MQPDMQQYIQQALLVWYDQSRRDLPWRQTVDPFSIWVSEIMLQQTRVDTVIPYYKRFLERFPTLLALADAKLDEVLVLWKGLGYYTRARNLYLGAKYVVDNYDGIVPSTLKEIKGIAGIGDYTAGAILSIAYNLPYPAVDGNVIRVLSRVYAIDRDVAEHRTKKEIHLRAQALVPSDRPGAFNQAVMDLGAGICTPTNPGCFRCPLRDHCVAQQLGIQEQLPIKQPRPQRRMIQRQIAIICRDNRFLLVKRPEKGLFGGLWEFPGFDWTMSNKGLGDNSVREIGQWIFSEFGCFSSKIEPLLNGKHVFTHMEWQMQAYLCEIQGPVDNIARGQWYSVKEMDALAIPTAYKMILAWIACTYS